MWDDRYTTEDYVFGSKPNKFLERSVARIPSNGSVLAVADGEGRNGVWLAEQGFQVHSVDSSSVGISKAKALAKQRDVSLQFEEADLLNWSWPPNQFDAVVAIFIQFAGPVDRQSMFRGIVQSLKPGGVLLLEGYRTEQLQNGTGGPPTVENLYTEECLREELSALNIDDIQSYDEYLEEGAGHSGLSALIDLIAYKNT